MEELPTPHSLPRKNRLVIGVFASSALCFTIFYAMTTNSWVQQRAIFLQPDVPFEVSYRGSFIQESVQPCTFSILRQYYRHLGHLPGHGKVLYKPIPHYQPAICKFKQPRMSKPNIAKCLKKAKITSIMTIGDSNAGRHYMAFQSYFEKCKVTGHEELKERGFLPDVDYYKDHGLTQKEWNNFIKVHYRFCSGCAGRSDSCTVDDGRQVELEHLPMTLVLDNSISLEIPTFGLAVHTIDQVWALTSQEFAFRYFLKDRYPDLFIIFLPFNHAKHLLSERLLIDIKYFHSMLRFYLPSRTKVIYMPAFSEFESRRKSKKWVNATFENMMSADKIDKLNHVLFKALENDLLNATSNTYTFLDMVNITRPLEEWSPDGVHMNNTWYEMATSMVLETFCNSFELDAF